MKGLSVANREIWVVEMQHESLMSVHTTLDKAKAACERYQKKWKGDTFLVYPITINQERT